MSAALWNGVILRAIEDATMNPDLTKSASKRRIIERDRARARSWLASDSEDFRLVCFLADRDPVDVARKALVAIEKADAFVAASPSLERDRQNTDRRSSSFMVRRFTFQGRTLTVREWSNLTGIPPNVLHNRFKVMNVEEALTKSYRGVQPTLPSDSEAQQ